MALQLPSTINLLTTRSHTTCQRCLSAFHHSITAQLVRCPVCTHINALTSHCIADPYNNNNIITTSPANIQTTSHPSTHYQTTLVNELLQLAPDELMEYLMDLPNTPLTDDDADLLEDFEVTGSRWFTMTKEEYNNIGLERDETVNWLIQTAKLLLSGGIIGLNGIDPNGDPTESLNPSANTTTPTTTTQTPIPNQHNIGINVVYTSEEGGNVDDEYYYSEQFNKEGVSLVQPPPTATAESLAPVPLLIAPNDTKLALLAAQHETLTAQKKTQAELSFKEDLINTIKAEISKNNTVNISSSSSPSSHISTTISVDVTPISNPTVTESGLALSTNAYNFSMNYDTAANTNTTPQQQDISTSTTSTSNPNEQNLW